MYDINFFFERKQFVDEMREYLEENFYDSPLYEVFNEIVTAYEKCVALSEEWETCFDEAKKRKIARRYEEIAEILQQYLGVIKKTMDVGLEALEGKFIA